MSSHLPDPPMHAAGKWFEEVAVGERFSARLTITDRHLVLGAGLIGDFNPHHVDDEYARQSRFGTRVLHDVELARRFSSGRFHSARTACE